MKVIIQQDEAYKEVFYVKTVGVKTIYSRKQLMSLVQELTQ